MQFFLDNDESKKKFSLMLAGEIMCELPIFVCIGSDRVVSDMIGPLTAEIMVKKYNSYLLRFYFLISNLNLCTSIN